MQRLLIPLFVCLAIGMPSVLLAQIPQSVSLPPGPFKYPAHQEPASPDMVCNFAGTYSLVQFIGKSNDTDLPQIFLCRGDSFLIRHNGDAILTGDPQPGTPPGVAYAFYTCPPTIIGDNLQAIASNPGPGDPCVLKVPPAANGLYITPGISNGGDTWFFNSGTLISTFGLGQPLSLYYAPITVDEITPPAGFESAVVGSPPGPCVNVNTNAAFQVIYLNPITGEGLNSNFGNDCLGKFTVRGGYPEYNNTAVYTIEIHLTSDPSVKAVIHPQQSQLFHLAPVIFSVPQPGNYTITIVDGKACPATFTMDMNVCNPSDNITVAFPDTIAPPATSNFCVPLTVQNFDIVSGSFSINWDPNVLQYTGTSNLSPVLDPFTGATLNDGTAPNGQIGLILYDQNDLGNVLSVPDGETLFEVCFNVVGVLGQCTGLTITNNPTAVGFEGNTGQTLALTADTGSVCVQLLPIDFQIAIFDSTCLGTASMRITATGGESPYFVTVQEVGGATYSGNIVGSGSNFTINNTIGAFDNLPRTYYVCVTDSNGLGTTVCDTIDVLIPTLGAQITFVKEPSCNGYKDGILNGVVLVGGVPVTNPGPNYTFMWSATPALVNPTLANQDGTINNDVHAGNYTLVVTDNVRMCSATALGALGQPTLISRDMVTLTPASCSGVANGTISYLVKGGTPFAGGQYQFTWKDANNNPVGAPGMNNPIVINGVGAGLYRVTITDANGCTKIDSVTVTDQRVVTLNPGMTSSVTCFGLSTGTAQVSVTESAPSGHPYMFTWSPTPACMGVGTSLSSGYTCLAAGNYFITALDQTDGCKDTLTINITQPARLVLDTLGLLGPNCVPPNSGGISVIAQGGTGGPNYTFKWSNMATGASQNSLAAGTYSVTVTDTKGCKDSLTFVLPLPTGPTLTVDSIPVKCGGDGSLIANAPTAMSYKWTAVPTAGTIDITKQINNLQGGTYAVTVTDDKGCTKVDTVTLQGVIPMSFADTSIVQPLCYGFKDGILGVLVQDGKQPYTSYVWNPTQPAPVGPTIFSIGAGNYSVTVTDNVGCTLTGSFTVNQPPQVVNTLSGIQDVSCFGVCDGAAQIATNYATTPPTTGNFIYIWSDGNSTSAMRTDLCAGTYIVTSADNNSCGDTDTLTIGTPPEVSATNTTVPSACFGQANGSATIMGTGGNGAPYTYLWSDPNNTMTSTANNLAAGEYVVTVTDSNGCTGVVDSVFVTEPEEIVVMQDLVQTDNPNCFGNSDGLIVVTVTGGNAGQLQYAWSDDTGVIGNTEGELDGIPAGFYSVVVTDAQGCTGSLSDIMLTDPPPVLGSYDAPEALVCNGDVTTLKVNSISGGSGGPYQFSLDYGALLDVNFPVTLSGGDHYVTYFDSKGCFYTDTINVPEPAPIDVTFSPMVKEIELGDTTYQLKPLITGAAVASFTWTPAELLKNPLDLNPYVLTYQSQKYTLVVFDDKGCSGTGSVLINIDPNRNVYVPNIFKPGVGGLNDHFNVYLGRGIDIVNYMRVYDRWGELMYSREKFLPQNDNFADGWDGKYRGDFVNPGVFVYIIEVKFLDGRVLLYRGDVTVYR